MRGVTKTVRGEQMRDSPVPLHAIVKRNATETDLAQARLYNGTMVHQRVMRGHTQVLYTLVDVYIDDLKRLVAILAQATAINDENNQGVQEEDDNANTFEEDAT